MTYKPEIATEIIKLTKTNRYVGGQVNGSIIACDNQQDVHDTATKLINERKICAHLRTLVTGETNIIWDRDFD